MKTLSVTPINPEGPDDLNNILADGIVSLSQRVGQAIKFRFGTWFVNTQRGVPYDRIMGHQTTLGLATATITATIREEGGAEVLDVLNVVSSLDPDTRYYSYSAQVTTIYGMMEIRETTIA